VTTADAISVIVVIMRHMRFLFFCYVQQKPDKDLTEEVRGLFPRVAQKIEISVLGAQVVRGESHLTGGLGRESACVSDERHQRREKGRVPGRSDGRVSDLGIVTETRRCAPLLRKQGFAPEAIVTDKPRSYGACHPGARSFSAA
jgi:hypothetical protein